VGETSPVLGVGAQDEAARAGGGYGRGGEHGFNAPVAAEVVERHFRKILAVGPEGVLVGVAGLVERGHRIVLPWSVEHVVTRGHLAGLHPLPDTGERARGGRW
jgi:hypothetical protein